MTQQRECRCRQRARPRWSWLLLLLAGITGGVAEAHNAGASYLRIDASDDRGALTGTWEIAVDELQWTLDLDADGDAMVSARELQDRRAAIARLAIDHLVIIQAGVPCRAGIRDLRPIIRGAQPFVSLGLSARCAATGALGVSTDLFFGHSAYTALLEVTTLRGRFPVVLSPTASSWMEAAAPTLWETLARFLTAGVWHTWIGYDHIAFLVLLLLPVVLRVDRGTWHAAESWRPVFWAAVRIVTAFTIAHSITLSLAALGWVRPPDRPVEMLIAASVAVAGALNLFPALARFSVLIAFGFGLVHGFGFAAVLGELGLHFASLAWALAGFNLGVEVGQLTIVATLLPVLYALRTSIAYRRRVVPATSILVALLALVWFAERAG